MHEEQTVVLLLGPPTSAGLQQYLLSSVIHPHCYWDNWAELNWDDQLLLSFTVLHNKF